MILNIKWFKNILKDCDNFSAELLSEKLTSIGCESEVIDESRLEVKIFPNRGDCLSVYGLAREYSAFFGGSAILPNVYQEQLVNRNFLPFKISDSAAPAIKGGYLLKISNYHSAPSPRAILDQLEKLNVHGKDLAIDLSNFVSYELGVPLHLFDYDKVKSGLFVDYANEGETITVLTGQQILLSSKNLIQRSNNQIVDLAGIMGGLSSCVTSATKTLLVQSAVFAPESIYLSRKSAGLSTEASYRYERFVDVEMALPALLRFVELLKQFQSSVKVEQLQSYQNTSTSIKGKEIKLNQKNIYRLLGEKFNREHEACLNKLGIKKIKSKLLIPSWRADLQNDYDIAEELLRFSLAKNQYPSCPLKKISKKQPNSHEYENLTSLKQILTDSGISEVSNDSLIDLNEAKIFYNSPLILENPQSRYLNAYRTTLLIGLLKTLSKNQWLGRAAFFEIGQIFTDSQKTFLAVVLFCYKEASMMSIAQKLKEVLKFKGDLNFLKVESSLLEKFDIRQRNVWFWETDCNEFLIGLPLLKLSYSRPQAVKKVSKFPPSVRDITFEVEKNISEDSLSRYFLAKDEVIICELLDAYSGEQVRKGFKALTYKIVMQDQGKTLTDEEVNALLNSWLNQLAKKVKFIIR